MSSDRGGVTTNARAFCKRLRELPKKRKVSGTSASANAAVSFKRLTYVSCSNRVSVRLCSPARLERRARTREITPPALSVAETSVHKRLRKRKRRTTKKQSRHLSHRGTAVFFAGRAFRFAPFPSSQEVASPRAFLEMSRSGLRRFRKGGRTEPDVCFVVAPFRFTAKTSGASGAKHTFFFFFVGASSPSLRKATASGPGIVRGFSLVATLRFSGTKSDGETRSPFEGDANAKGFIADEDGEDGAGAKDATREPFFSRKNKGTSFAVEW